MLTQCFLRRFILLIFEREEERGDGGGKGGRERETTVIQKNCLLQVSLMFFDGTELICESWPFDRLSVNIPRIYSTNKVFWVYQFIIVNL